jgi:adenosylcobinamide kinase / adenosylcobinamide-phosphate guanylyltransferase
MNARNILVGGGARSGKSRFALALAESLGLQRIFVAPAQAFDEEMATRIARHREERGPGWTTIEEPTELARALADASPADVVLVDCLTLWLSNLLLRGDAPAAIEQQVEEVVQTLRARARHVVLVTNEVGMGIVPENALARLFRDVAGRANQRIAAAMDEVYLASMGITLRLRPAPVVALGPGERP